MKFDIEKRLIWFLSLFGFTLIIGGALFFQHIKGMEPCYLCIIQRIGVIISILGCLIGIVNPKIKTLKYMGLITLFSGLFVSLYSSIKLVYMQLNPPLFSSCGMSAKDLMENYGFMKSLPLLFEGSASCSESAGSFLFMTFEQWTLSIFILATLLTITVIFKNFKQGKKHE